MMNNEDNNVLIINRNVSC